MYFNIVMLHISNQNIETEKVYQINTPLINLPIDYQLDPQTITINQINL